MFNWNLISHSNKAKLYTYSRVCTSTLANTYVCVCVCVCNSMYVGMYVRNRKPTRTISLTLIFILALYNKIAQV